MRKTDPVILKDIWLTMDETVTNRQTYAMRCTLDGRSDGDNDTGLDSGVYASNEVMAQIRKGKTESPQQQPIQHHQHEGQPLNAD